MLGGGGGALDSHGTNRSSAGGGGGGGGGLVREVREELVKVQCGLERLRCEQVRVRGLAGRRGPGVAERPSLGGFGKALAMKEGRERGAARRACRPVMRSDRERPPARGGGSVNPA